MAIFAFENLNLVVFFLTKLESVSSAAHWPENRQAFLCFLCTGRLLALTYVFLCVCLCVCVGVRVCGYARSPAVQQRLQMALSTLSC